jgi:hypothetical protein
VRKGFLAGFVPQQPLGGNGAETATEKRQAQKLAFGDAPLSAARSRLVPPEDAERHDVQGQETER